MKNGQVPDPIQEKLPNLKTAQVSRISLADSINISIVTMRRYVNGRSKITACSSEMKTGIVLRRSVGALIMLTIGSDQFFKLRVILMKKRSARLAWGSTACSQSQMSLS
jgi:hypothetical protein